MKFKYLFLTIIFALCLSINLRAQLKARVFEHPCFQGKVQYLYANSYYQSQLYIVGNDKISSIVVEPGWEIELYEHNAFGGDCYAVSSDINALKPLGWEDKVSSIKIVPKTVLPNIASDKTLPDLFIGAKKIKEIQKFQPTINKSIHTTLQSVSKLHSQGLGWDNISGNYVYTGCRSSGIFNNGCQGESHIVLFNSNLTVALDATISEKYNGKNGGKSHPSAIQVTNGIFPVAIEKEGEVGCYIEFYQVDQNKLKYLGTEHDIKTVVDHLGAMAYANINGDTYMLGATTNGKKIHIWSAAGLDNYKDLKYSKTIHTFNIGKCGVDQNYSDKYQSLWLGKMESGKIVLMASHGDNGFNGGDGWVDLWEVSSLQPGPPIVLTKMNKHRTKRFLKKSHFYEGATFGPNNYIMAAPHDFKIHTTYILRADMFKLKYEYNDCEFGKYETQVQDAPAPKAIEKDRTIALEASTLNKEQALPTNEVIKYFPNPFRHQLTIDIASFNQAEDLDTWLSITNISGKLVRKIRLTDLTKGNQHLSLDLSDLTEGIYFFTLQNQQHHSTQKIIKLNP